MNKKQVQEILVCNALAAFIHLGIERSNRGAMYCDELLATGLCRNRVVSWGVGKCMHHK